jgi:hypothetical protein
MTSNALAFEPRQLDLFDSTAIADRATDVVSLVWWMCAPMPVSTMVAVAAWQQAVRDVRTLGAPSQTGIAASELRPVPAWYVI